MGAWIRLMELRGEECGRLVEINQRNHMLSAWPRTQIIVWGRNWLEKGRGGGHLQNYQQWNINNFFFKLLNLVFTGSRIHGQENISKRLNTNDFYYDLMFFTENCANYDYHIFALGKANLNFLFLISVHFAQIISSKKNLAKNQGWFCHRN